MTKEPKGCPTPGACSALKELSEFEVFRKADFITVENANAEIDRLRQQLDVMTKERNSERYKHEQCVTINERLLSDIRCALAREAKLLEVVLLLIPSENGWAKLGPYGVALAVSALAIPFDDSPLQERLKQERERVANAAIEAWKCGKDIAAAIRALT